MTYLFSVLMGVLQGVAEFLPISSSGHLALFQHFFGVENYEETQMFFTVLLHLGTLISVCVYYWRDVIDMIREFFLGIRDLTVRRGGGAPPAPHPAAGNDDYRGHAAAVRHPAGEGPGGGRHEQRDFCLRRPAGHRLHPLFLRPDGQGRKNARNATVADALLVGCAQAVGTLPGISRSGITISAGLLRGFDRTFAVRFSFLMSLPAVLGANILSLKDALEAGVDLEMLPIYLVGMVVSGVVGYFAIRLVNLLADKGKFGNFAYYCWVVGLGSLIASFVVK